MVVVSVSGGARLEPALLHVHCRASAGRLALGLLGTPGALSAPSVPMRCEGPQPRPWVVEWAG